MEINLALDDKLLGEALKLGGHSNESATVNEALLEYIQRRKQWTEPRNSGDGESTQSVSEANHRLLALLQTWKAEPLTTDEKCVLDELEAFQASHPLHFITPPDEL